MRQVALDRLFAALDGTTVALPTGLALDGVAIDSREDVAGKLFFAIPGERFDGHNFVLDVFNRGAAAVVVEEAVFARHPDREAITAFATGNGRALFVARDSRRALGDAAAAALAFWQPLVIAVTGSSGKTTTRRIIETLLAGDHAVRTGVKNFNNDIGLPLTVFSLEAEDGILLLEMGMNHAGELLRLADIARPKIVVVTNIGSAHIEYLGSRDGIAAAKKEALAFFDDSCTAILNTTDEYYAFLAEGVRGDIVGYGSVPENFTVVSDDGLSGYLLGYAGGETRFALGGAHNLTNLAAGVAVARKLGLAESVIAARIGLVRAVDSRSEVTGGRFCSINDCYNANPESMRAGLSLLAAARGSRRVAVLADMLELGGDSTRLHGELGEWIAGQDCCDELVLVGPEMAACAEGARRRAFPADRLHLFPSRAGLADFLAAFVRDGDTVLFKGSRGMHLEEVMAVLH